MPLQKLIVFCRAFCLFLNPAKYATVTGKSDNEQGPKLVKRPPAKTNRRVKGVGLFRPLLIISSPLRVKSDKIRLIEEMLKKRFASLIYTPDYLVKSLFEEFLTKTSEDSTDDLTNKAAISRLAINEFPP